MNILELHNTLDELYQRDLISMKHFHLALEQVSEMTEKVNKQTEDDRQDDGNSTKTN